MKIFFVLALAIVYLSSVANADIDAIFGPDDDLHQVAYNRGTLAIKEVNTLPVRLLTRVYRLLNFLVNRVIFLMNLALVFASTWPARVLSNIIFPFLLPFRIMLRSTRMMLTPFRLPLRLIESVFYNIRSVVVYVIDFLMKLIKPRAAHLFPYLPEIEFFHK